MSQKFLNPVEVNGQVSAEYLDLSTTTTHTAGVGELVWNDTDGTMDIGLKGGNVKLQVGQEQLARVVNKTSPLINLLESDYQVVVITGATGQRLSVKLAQGNNDANSAGTLGVVTETINANQEGFITISGQVREINTTGSLQGETWSDGDLLFLSATTPGAITNIRPIAPNHTVNIGYVEYAHAIHGKIYVKVDNGYELGELHDVDTSESKTTPIDADNLLLQDSADLNVWKKLSWSNTKATLKTYFDTLYQSVLTNPITGTGTTNYVSKFTGTTSLGNSQIFDNGTNVGIGTTSPSAKITAINNASGWAGWIENQDTTGNGSGLVVTGASNAGGISLFVRKQDGTGTFAVLGNGNVGIGTTSPSGKLDVIGNLYTSGEFRIGASYAATGTGLIKSNSGVLSLFTWGDSTNIQIGGSDVIFKPEAGSERMRLTSAGNLGIGVSAPGYKTQIESSSSVVFLSKNTSSTSFNRSYFYNNSDVGIQIQAYGSAYPFGTLWPGGANSADITCNAANGLSIGTSTASAFVLGTNSAERMRIDSSGNILVGQTSPIYSATNRANLTIGKSAGSIIVLGTSTAANGYLFYNNTDIELANSTSSGSVFFRTSGTERMRITSAGAVGIGTSSPSGKFEIDASGSFNWGFPSTAVAKIGTKGTGGSLLISTPSLNSSYESGFAVDGTYTSGKSVINLSSFGVYSGGPYSSDIAFRTTSQTTMSEAMRITSSGNVGIGTSSPGGRLQVSSATAGDDQIWLQSTTYTGGYSTLGYNANTGEFRIKQNDGGSAGITFYTGASASEKMRITPSGNVGIGTSSPSNKLEVSGNAYFSTGSSYAAFQSTFSILSNYAGYNAGINSNLGTLDSNYNVILFASDTGNTYPASLAVQSDGSTSTGTTNRQQLSMEGLLQTETVPSDTTTPVKWIKVYNVDDNTHYFIPAYQ